MTLRLEGSRARTFKRLVFATYGDVCWLCEHGGARQVDHLEPVTEHPELLWDIRNCRPAHGAPGNKCPVCRQNCNQLRGWGTPERARRIIAERTPAAARKPEKAPVRDAGRDW